MAPLNEVSIIFLPTDWASAISLLISSLATTLVVIYGVHNKIYKHVLGKMVLIVNAADLAFCLIYLSVRFLAPANDMQCKIVQAFAHSTLIFSLLWGTFFGHSLYIMSKYQNLSALQKSYKDYIRISVVFSLGLGIATIFTNYTQFSATEKSCVHLVRAHETDVTLIIFSQIPISVVCLLGVFWYISAGLMLKKGTGLTRINNILTLLIYPGIVIICWLPVNIVTVCLTAGVTISRGVDGVTKNLYQLQGLFDAMGYGIAPVMKKRCASNNQVDIEYSEDEDAEINKRCSSLIQNEEEHPKSPDL